MAKEPIAKEPVTREPVHEQPEEPGRVVGQTPPPTIVRRAPEPVDEDGWRACSRPDCGSKFKPDTASRTFCSEECAQIMFYRENGMQKSADALMAKERRTDDGEIIRERRGGNPEKEALKEARYGPLRDVGDVISRSKGGKRVVFEPCKHQGAVAGGAKRGRCRVCKNLAANPDAANAGVDAASVQRRVAVQREGRSVREPVKREPVSVEKFVERGQAAQKAVDAEIAKVAKREPVKRVAVKRKPVAKNVTRKPVKRTTKKPVKAKKGKR